WKAISAFAAMSIGEALHHFNEQIPEKMREKWMTLFVRLANFIYEKINEIHPVANYHAGAACVGAMAWKLTGEKRYLDFAHEQEAICRAQFDENGLFFGEGHPIDYVTEKGCRYIDIGYAIEESLPLLLRYAVLTGEGLDFYRDRYRDHMELILPDGGMDNSWGSRHNKWTWWGSRTSDGAIEGLAWLLDEPIFADICERVLTLYENCTHDGLLGLPMAKDAGEPTCLHHSFCHAKALATLVLTEPVEVMRTVLPCESDYGVKWLQNKTVALVSHKGWRATVSACDAQYLPQTENGGGSMTLLMHEKTPVCASTMRDYTPSEPLNMQYLRKSDQTPCMTPRLVFENGSNLTEKGVHLEQPDALSVRAVGENWNIEYRFGEAVEITVCAEPKTTFVLPVIRSGDVTANEGRITVGDIVVTGNGMRCEPEAYGFNQVGGFIWLPIEIDVNGKTTVTVSVKK
ncbi:MAG: hypothetical protein IIV87_04400, partial [Oscillospiraceae bacterium]|nr:hypothetical protein [Oscillospiraceae bacterium]